MSIPIKEISLRWEQLRKSMAGAELDGLLIFSNQIKRIFIHYVANYTLLGEQAFFYLPLAGQPILFISEPWDHARAIKESPGIEVNVLGKKWPLDIAAVCKSGKGRLGLAGRESMGRLELGALEEAIGRETVSAAHLLEQAATIKSPYELALIREAARMADVGFTRALEVIKHGLPDYKLVAEIDYAMREMGATDNFQKQISGMLLPFGKKVEKGDLLLFEITPANGPETYSAQLCRTAVFGESPDELLQSKYRLLIEALEESLSVIKPGVRISEVARIQNEIIGKAGYEEYCQPPYMRARGHGFGLGRIDVEEDSTLEFAEGMSLVVHPNQFLPETGYLALGEHIIITATGMERLTRTESKIYECPDVG
jgi:Xaa-Pro dipeptidase